MHNRDLLSLHSGMTTQFDWADLQAALRGTSIYLVGMMGAGKTTIGRELAHQLNYRFTDSDVLIEAVAKQSIPEIFAQLGEAEFRNLESQVLMELSQYPRMVIATGGGDCGAQGQLGGTAQRHCGVVGCTGGYFSGATTDRRDSTTPTGNLRPGGYLNRATGTTAIALRPGRCLRGLPAANSGGVVAPIGLSSFETDSNESSRIG